MFHSSYQLEEIRSSYHPIEWWEHAPNHELPQGFKHLIRKLFSLLASTGGIERIFSTLGNIMTSQRNRLSLDKAAKLCSVHNHFKILENEQGIKRDRASRKRKFPFSESDSN